MNSQFKQNLDSISYSDIQALRAAKEKHALKLTEWPDYFNTPRDVYSDYCYSMDELKYLKAELKSLGVSI